MFAIKKTNQRAEDVLPHTGPRSIRLPEPMSPLWRVLSWLNTVSALREEAGLKEGGCKEEEEGGGRGWHRKERRAECQDVAQQAFSLSNRQNYHYHQKKHTIQDHALTEKSVTPPPAHIPTQTCKYECTYHKHTVKLSNYTNLTPLHVTDVISKLLPQFTIEQPHSLYWSQRYSLYDYDTYCS